MTRDADAANKNDTLARSINRPDKLPEGVDSAIGFEPVIVSGYSRVDRPPSAYGGSDVELDDPYALPVVYPLKTYGAKTFAGYVERASDVSSDTKW